MALSGYKELIVWQKSMDLVEEIYILTKDLPKDELYGINAQMRRSAVSVPSNIAEGHSRRYTKEFIHFLAVSQGSCAELETQLLICNRLNLLEEGQTERALSLCGEIGRMLTVMSSKLQNKL